MRIYKVKAVGDSSITEARWVTSKEDAASARAELTSKGYRRDSITTTDVDFTSTKVGIVEMLNEHAD